MTGVQTCALPIYWLVRSKEAFQSINPDWPDLPHSNSNLSNFHSLSCLIQGILLLQTNTLALFLHLYLLCLLWSSLLTLALHFKFQCFSQNMPIIPPQHMPLPSHSICLCHLNHCFHLELCKVVITSKYY